MHITTIKNFNFIILSTILRIPQSCTDVKEFLNIEVSSCSTWNILFPEFGVRVKREFRKIQNNTVEKITKKKGSEQRRYKSEAHSLEKILQQQSCST